MRTQTPSDDRVAEINRRRLELLGAGELPLLRSAPGKHARRPVGRRARLGGWLHDRLPATLQGRVRLEPAQLGVLALVIAVGLGLSAWWVLRSPDTGSALPLRPPTTAPALVPVAATPSPTADQVVVVDVTGRVRRPGIATLPLGSRVVDALRAAGGVRAGVDPTSINRARLLVDGEQIVVGRAPAQGVAAQDLGSAPGGSALVNLNSADQATLEQLPGVGPVTAASILAWREENGGFRSVDELLEVSGIGDATLAELAPHVTL